MRRLLSTQPVAVWAVGFAAVVSFMGLGLVDPILPAIAHDLRASPSDVELPVYRLLLNGSRAG